MVATILETIKRAVEKECHYDKTFTAKVIDLTNNKHKCYITYNGVNYLTSTTIPVSVNDWVRVTAPCNDFNDLFIVENKSVE